jgi:hypothetical protein
MFFMNIYLPLSGESESEEEDDIDQIFVQIRLKFV